jgi:hypothetical protein
MKKIDVLTIWGWSGLILSGFLIFILPKLDWIGFFGALLMIFAFLVHCVCLLAIIIDSLRTNSFFIKICTITVLFLYSYFYFLKILPVVIDDYFPFHLSWAIFLLIFLPILLNLRQIILYPFKGGFEQFTLDKIPKKITFGIITIWLLFGQYSVTRVKDGFTSPEVLAKKIQEDASKNYRVGAICNDGTKSFALGSGACSWHGGVYEWVYETKFNKSRYQCLKEAKEISWID